MTDRQNALAIGLHAAATGSLATWTRGQLHALQDTIDAATERDVAAAAESIIRSALQTVLERRWNPTKRPKEAI